MCDFFPDVLAAADLDEPKELHQPVWLNPPEDQLPGVAAVELVLGASDRAVVMLTGMRVFPVGVAMTPGVRTRGPIAHRDLSSELFDGPHHHDQGERWQRDRLKWGFEFSDARRATNLDVASPEVPGRLLSNPLCPGVGAAVGRGRSTGTTGCGRYRRAAGWRACVSGWSWASSAPATTSTPMRSVLQPDGPAHSGPRTRWTGRGGEPAAGSSPGLHRPGRC